MFKQNSKNKNDHEENSTHNFDRPVEVEDYPQTAITDDKITSFIRKIRNSDEKLVVPHFDLVTGRITYPLLHDICENATDVSFLENLTKPSIDILEKDVYERIAVCPNHPNSYDVNVRFYCPKCNSMDIEKLHLFEHKICGYISEKKNFVVSEKGMITQCPSCNMEIKDCKKELRIPAMWYSCFSCQKKFDDVVMKLHCREFNHDFDTNMARTITIHCFKLKDLETERNFGSLLLENLKNLLLKFEYHSEENCSIKGKSGHYHNVDFVSRDDKNNTIFIFLIKSNKEVDESQVNSKIIPILDLEPTSAIILCSSISVKAKSLAARYQISVIESLDSNDVVSSLDELISKKFNIMEIT